MNNGLLEQNITRMCQEYSDEQRLQQIPRIIATAKLRSFEDGIHKALEFVREYNLVNQKPQIEIVPGIQRAQGEEGI